MWDNKVMQGDMSPNRIAGEMVPTPSPASRSSARRWPLLLILVSV